MVLDFGGVYGGYCVDLTRTVALGEPDAEMQRVYGAVLEAQKAAIAAVKPGVRAGDIDAAARETLGRHELAEAFGHSTGHGLGVEIHETPRVGPRREATGDAPAPPDEAIEPGMVFTIEPGAYLPGWGGVRIEDDVLVTSDGVEVLTNVPTQLQSAWISTRLIASWISSASTSSASSSSSAKASRFESRKAALVHAARARLGAGRRRPRGLCGRPAGRTRATASGGRAGPAAAAFGRSRLRDRQVAHRRHVLPRVRSPAPPPFVEVGDHRQEGAGSLHHRSDEADERDRLGIRRRDREGLRRERPARAIRRAAVRHQGASRCLRKF